MKILLLAFSVQERMFPLSLAYLKGYLSKMHSDVDVAIKEFSFGSRFSYETNKHIELAALSYIALERPDVVAFSCYIWSGDAVRDFARAIKRIDSSIKVVVGGVEVTASQLEGAIDFAIYGEGEVAFAHLVSYLKGERELGEVANVFSLQNGELVRGPRHEIEHLDELVFPYTQLEDEGYDVVRVESARGCVYSCAFCHYAQPSLRYFSLAYLKTWLGYLFENFSFCYLTLLDANFNTDRERMFAILDLLETLSSGRELYVHVELRPELIDEAMASRLSSYSFEISCELGLQSTHPNVLKAVNRPTNIERVKLGLAALEKARLKYKIDLMYGLPEDTFIRFLHSARFLLRNALSQKRLVAHHYMQLNNTALMDRSDIERFSQKSSSMVIRTSTQDVVDLHVTKLFLDQLNKELVFYR